MPTTAEVGKAILANALDQPGDPVPKLAYADWLSEAGYTDLAYAYCWAAKRDRHPFVAPYRQRTHWGTLRRGQHWPVCRHQLPPLVYHALKRAKDDDCVRGAERAFFWLADALKRLREATEL